MIKTDDEFAKKWGELGPIYGRQWRNWNAIFDGGVDQITNLINDLKNNPDSRRLMVNAWNVGELNQMLLPPCHYGFQCYVREGKYLSLMWNQRSVDTPLGLPFNIASYALLLMMIADEVNMVPDQLIGNLGDCHIYLDQVDGVKEQLTRQPMSLPKVTIQDGIYCSSPSDVLLENYESHPAIKFPLSN
jgi:thymidylate synthase